MSRGDEELVRGFIAFVWDIGLQIGHSVRSVDQCETDARSDPIFATTLMESRLLVGPAALFEELLERTGPEHLWSGPAFFEARCLEQRERHRRFDDTASNLEPNVKDGPGGLRDIHTVDWIAKRHFGTGTLRGTTGDTYLTRSERRFLRQSRDFLWEVRFPVAPARREG